MANIKMLSTRKKEMYLKDAETIAYLRRNPVIACEELLGIKLMDSQKWILQEAWNKPYVCIAASRNFGKSFLGAIIMLLRALLYENQKIYIVSSVGSQSQETFTKIEEIVLRKGKTSDSLPSLKDIAMNEVVKSPACKTGFSHSQTGYHVGFYNGSEIFTLNGNSDNNRSKRATVVFFDEAGFSSDELITTAEAFTTQSSDFKLSTDDEYDVRAEKIKPPNQLIYASSASHVDAIFYRKYRDFAKQMILGNRDYFCADIPCTIPMAPMVDGKESIPLLTQSKVDTAMRANREKASREYYNLFLKDGGAGQIIKWAQIRRNEILSLPEFYNKDNAKYVVAFDPARSGDNSIVTVMKLVKDPEIGWYGEIVNCTNLIDIGSKKGYKMSTPEQIKYLKQVILDYNGHAADYENIDALLIDSGAGGGGITAFSDNLLENWVDKKGTTHRGFLDRDFDLYDGYERKYPDASNKLNLISPHKWRTQMVDEFIKLMEVDLIKFTNEYNGSGRVNIIDESGEVKIHQLSTEEEIAMINIDILKTEMTSIYKFMNAEGTSKRYALPKEKENKMHDDRFYTIIMLSHFLYQLRREDITNKKPKKTLNASTQSIVLRTPTLRKR